MFRTSIVREKLFKLLNRLLYWRLKHINDRNFLILVSVLVGIPSALAAVILKRFVHLTHSFAQYLLKLPVAQFISILLPVIGILLTVIITRIFFKGKLEKGLGSILYAISRKSSKIEKDKMYSHVITSGITVGFGGSAGLEAPIVITGSSIGSNIATALNLGYKERSLMLACGAASGIAAVFNSPIAGVIFAMEVLLTEITIPAFIPILISTATSIIVSKLLYSDQLHFPVGNEWYIHAIPFYILLGVLCGLLSVYITRITLGIEGYFNKRKSIFKKALWGGLSLGVLIFIFPPLYGEGYSTIKDLLMGDYSSLLSLGFLAPFKDNPWLILIMGVFLTLIKVIATSLTTGSGGNGGIFAPSLFIGALAGFSLAFFVNTAGIADLNVSNFIVVGMAGILSGVVHAPLTAIFLIAEVTGGYVLFVPLMIVSALSYFIGKYFEPYSVYTKKLAQKKQLVSSDRDLNILSLLNIADLVESDFIPLKSHGTLKSLVDAFEVSNRNVYPVVDADNNFLGVIYLEKVKGLLFKPELYQEIKIMDITDTTVVPIDSNQGMELAMEKFENSNHWNLPVIENGKYIGIISRANVFSAYRRMLKKSSSAFL
ncbi:MAG TPA: chloride channel protein [Bacteroidales bacterium]|nr:chloride channel protein [Bacteroidales bacterium]